MTPTHPNPARSVTRVLVGSAVGVGVLWAAIVLLWGDVPFALTFDDAFYYFGIARNVAHGHGSTFDGINPTNGYHPLWMLIVVPFFAAGLDGTAAARVLLLVQVACYGAALVVLARTAGRAIDGWGRVRDQRGEPAARWCTALVAAALVIVVANPFVVKVFVNGLESGVLVLLDAAVLAIAASRRDRWLSTGSATSRLAIGVLLSLVVLGRTDSVLLVGALGLWTLLEARTLGWRAVRPLLELFALPAVTLLVYLVSNRVMFGITLQISGTVKRASLTADRLTVMAVAIAIAFVVGWWGARRVRRPAGRRRFARVGSFAASTSWFASFCIVMLAYYQELQTQQWLWYYCPLVLYLLFLLVLGVADFAEAAVLESSADASLGRALAPVAAILFAPLLIVLVLQARSFADPDLRSIEVANRDAGQWIDANLPHDAVLASWDAGVVGYYARRPVMNLDGVANSAAYDDATHDGTVGDFLAQRGLTGIVNHGTPVDGRDPEIEAFVRSVWGEDAASAATVTNQWPFTYSGNTVGSRGSGSGRRDLAVFLYAVSAPTVR